LIFTPAGAYECIYLLGNVYCQQILRILSSQAARQLLEYPSANSNRNSNNDNVAFVMRVVLEQNGKFIALTVMGP